MPAPHIAQTSPPTRRLRGRIDVDRQECERVVGAVAGLLRVPVAQIKGRGRGARIVFARQVAMYVANTGLGIGAGRIARCFGRDRSTVQYACRRMEDRRDDPSLDCQLDLIERLIREEGKATHDR
jgi:chromosomal replication initiation ATPase DnaA